jgi:hypothetical protein
MSASAALASKAIRSRLPEVRFEDAPQVAHAENAVPRRGQRSRPRRSANSLQPVRHSGPSVDAREFEKPSPTETQMGPETLP